MSSVPSLSSASKIGSVFLASFIAELNTYIDFWNGFVCVWNSTVPWIFLFAYWFLGMVIFLLSPILDFTVRLVGFIKSSGLAPALFFIVTGGLALAIAARTLDGFFSEYARVKTRYNRYLLGRALGHGYLDAMTLARPIGLPADIIALLPAYMDERPYDWRARMVRCFPFLGS